VGYPVVQLPRERRDAHAYLRDLEEALIRTARGYGLSARRQPGLTGVWVDESKLAAIGVRLSTGWITSHGFAINVSTELAYFDTIVPCGISGRGVTSLARLLPAVPPLDEVAGRVAAELAAVLGLRPVPSDEPVERLSWAGP
jgi:lipoyl(octanoyl) transferase